jgi:hypothetical protein
MDAVKAVYYVIDFRVGNEEDVSTVETLKFS